MSIARVISGVMGALFLAAGCGPTGRGVGADAHPRPSASAPAASAQAPDAGQPEGVEAGGCDVSTVGAVASGASLHLYASTADLEANHQLAEAPYETATFTLPRGATSEVASVQAAGFGVSLAALVSARRLDVWVKPTRKLAGGLLVPAQDTRIEIAGVERDSVRIRLKTHPLIDPAVMPIEEAVTCGDLAASSPPRPPPSPGKQVALGATPGLEVLVSPEAVPGSGLELVAPRAAVEIFLDAVELERRGRRVHVEVPSSSGIIQGWVAAAAVREPKPGGSGILASLGPTTSSTPRRDDTGGYDCPHPVRFAAVAREGDGPIWIGTARPGTRFERAPGSGSSPGWVPILLGAVKAHRLLVREIDLAGCTPPSISAP